MRRRDGLVALLAAALVVTGCSDPGAEGGTESGAAQWAEPTASLTGVKLTMWTAQNTKEAPDQVIKAFEAATGADVQTAVVPDSYENNVTTRLATGDKPDLMFWQPTGSMLTLIRARETAQSLDGAPWQDKLDASVKQVGVLDGTHYAAPVTTPAVIGVYYNKKVFATADITATPKNWTELMAVANQVKAAGVAPFFEVGGDKWPLQWGVQVQLADLAKDGLWQRVNQNKDGFTNPQIVAAIERYKGLFDGGLTNANYKTATFVDQGDALFAGQAGMAIQVNTLLAQIQASHSTAEINEAIGFFPISPTGNVGTNIPDQSNAVVAFKTGDAKRESAARQFLSFWLGPDYTEFVKARNTPSLQPAVSTPDGVPQSALDSAAALGSSVGSFQTEAIVNPDLYLNLADMIYGKKTPQQVAKATDDQFKQIAKAQGAAGF